MSLANCLQFDTETTTVSRYGAKLRLGSTKRNLVCGDHVRISQRGSFTTWRTARISWIDRAGYCGIELQDPENFWGIYFPQRPGETGAEEQAFAPLAIREGRQLVG